MKTTTRNILQELAERYPALAEKTKASVEEAFDILCSAYRSGHKLLICGNGGSCADAEHIVGELMKSFKKKRALPGAFTSGLQAQGEEGAFLADKLEGSLRAIALSSHPALSTAFSNDVDGSLAYAQQVSGLGDPGDVLLAISTSGNSVSCRYAVLAAKALGLTVIGLTGANGGKLYDLSDLCIRVPETETFKIQEYHLPVYHCLCAMLEEELFT